MGSSSCVVVLSGRAVFAWVVAEGTGVRLRVLSREWDALGLAEGQTVRIDGPGLPGGSMLIGAVRESASGRTVVVLAPPIVARRR
ncbi:hypothetical protein [Limnoglobus roseus]|uniref:Uncharacterized protein n=1 Tax=Limnoglobus roseus TaxID=2598579 RepID=A0A5C1A788_9BACT|nr:hypothetical protein [Limnoglobus roseus]QEL14055.1 hypothetical protein PX52LOC_00918 [Limnoglobus roseus]QEL14143.1 hypothetical protein PX52LOC_01013 [Limnoglobus roseus]